MRFCNEKDAISTEIRGFVQNITMKRMQFQDGTSRRYRKAAQ